MSWSYNPMTLAESKKDLVRFKIGDTTEGEALLADEEIVYLLEVAGDDADAAAIMACRAAISKLASYVDFTIGPYSESQGSRLKAYQMLYEQLVAEASKINAPMALAPTTSSIFHYDMMSTEGENHE